jgi:hypothetical protein
MVINNVEIKKGDCVIACATSEGGYHYMLGFAFKAEDVIDNKVRCMFYEISFDDFVIGVYPEQKDLGDLELPPAYDIYIVDEDAMNTYISQSKADDLDEDDVWGFFEAAIKHPIKTIHKYHQ